MNFDFEKISFEIISYAGEAKEYARQAIQEAKEKKFLNATDLLDQAMESTTKANNVHMDVICAEADGDKIPFSVLLMHAEDQLGIAEAFIAFATEIIEMYKNK